ncbi:YDG domain-containing protein [Selenomonas ruminantium]|nr:YDG domain-containing protein [Selenomonas ruminantium]
MKIGIALMAGFFSTSSLVLAADLPVLADGGAAANVAIQEAEKRMDIASTAAHNVLRWQDFSIGEKHTVAFDNKDYLNLVTGGVQSEILGTLTGGGNIYLINPNGILFGTDAQVNAGAFYASTRALPTEDVLNSFVQSGANPLASTVSEVGGDIINRGTIAADTIVLEAGRISIRNYADIKNKAGEVLSDENVQLKVKEAGDIHVGYNFIENDLQRGENPNYSYAQDDNGEYVATEAKEQTQYYWGTSNAPAFGYRATLLDGTETAVTPYMLIHNQYELQNINNVAWGGRNFMLYQDVDLGGMAFSSLEGLNNGGRFEGMSYTIRNLTAGNGGLFGSISGTTIENLNIDKAAITASLTDNHWAGTLAAGVNGSQGGAVIRNVHVTDSTVTGGYVTGGLVGVAGDSVITDSSFSGTVSGIGEIGGLVGSGTGITIKNSHNDGNVQYISGGNDNSVEIGGLMGNSTGAFHIENSYNQGTIMVSTQEGDAVNGSISAGGLIGAIDHNGNVDGEKILVNSYNTNTGTVSIMADQGLESIAAGGLIGKLDSVANHEHSFTFNTVYNEGMVTAAGKASRNVVAGGLIGYEKNNEALELSVAYNGGYYGTEQRGQVEASNLSTGANSYAGGLVGYVELTSSGSINFIDTYNTGIVSTPEGSSGGFIGAYAGADDGSFAMNNGYYLGSGLIGKTIDNYGVTPATITAYEIYKRRLDVPTEAEFPDADELRTAKENYEAQFQSSSYNWGGKLNSSLVNDTQNTWLIYDGHTLPMLTAFMTRGKLVVDKVYNGSAQHLTFDDISAKYDKYYVDSNPSKPETLATATDAGQYEVGVNFGNDAWSWSYQDGYDITGYTFAITPAPVTASFSKTYDGQTTINPASVKFAGLVGDDTVTVSGTAHNWTQGDPYLTATKNAGSSYAVDVAGLTLSSGNYRLISATGEITKKELTPGFTAISKTYDGTTDATAGEVTLDGVVAGDEVTATAASAAYEDKNAGRKNVTYSGLSLSGADAGNYSVAESASGIGTIKKATATLTAEAVEITEGDEIPALKGTVTGLVAGDSDKSTWSTKATSESKAGSYAINGTFADDNYEVKQAETNATALTIKVAEKKAEEPGTTTDPVNPPTEEPGTTTDPVNPPTEEPGTTTDPVNPPTEEPGTTTDPVNPPTEEPGTTTDPVNPPTEEPGTTTDPVNPSTEEPVSSGSESVINPTTPQEVAEALVQQDSRSTVVQAQNAATAATQENVAKSGSEAVSPEAAVTGVSVEAEQTSPVSVESENNSDNGSADSSDNNQQEKDQKE